MSPTKGRNLKIISRFLCFLLVFQLCFQNPPNVYAASIPVITYTIGGNPRVGNTVDIIVNVADSQNLYGGSVDFLYDSDLIEILGIEKGNIFGANTVQVPVQLTQNKGQASIALMLTGNKSGVTTSGTLAVIKAKILKPGTISLTTTSTDKQLTLGGSTIRVKLSDNNAKPINYSCYDKNIVLGSNVPLDAQLVSENIPTNMEPGKSYNASLTYENIGSNSWSSSEGHRLGLDSVSNSFENFGLSIRYDIPNNVTVDPGQRVTFNMVITAPEKDGNYSLNFKLLKEGLAWFGPVLNKNITVQRLPLSSTVVSDTLPSTMLMGETANATITIKNIGSQPWSNAEKHRLGLDFVSDAYTKFGLEGRYYLKDNKIVNPGETATFDLQLKAPTTSGEYKLNFKMLKEGLNWFGETFEKTITVEKPALNAEFVSDNIPSTMEPGKTYTGSVTFRNMGSEPWSTSGNHRLGLDSESETYASFGLEGRYYINNVIQPGQTATFPIEFKAPEKQGSYTIEFKMLKEGTSWFGSTFKKKIAVQGPPLSSAYISDNIPTTMESGKTYDVSITFKNTGSETWTAAQNFKLGLDYVSETYQQFGLEGRAYIENNTSVKPDESFTFKLKMKAPHVGGDYTLNFKMLKEGQSWFGPTQNKTIKVKPLILDSQLVSENIPTSMVGGTSYDIALTYKNTGSHPWTAADGYKLGLDYISETYKDFGIEGRAYINPAQVVNPGENITFNLKLTAPMTGGSYTLNFKMLKEGHAWFGPMLFKTINVAGKAALSYELVSENIPSVMEPGKTYNVSLKLKNTGAETWTASNKHRLGLDYVSESYKLFGLEGRAYLNSNTSIKSGETATFNLTIKAPTTVGNYSLDFKMLKEGVTWFGPTINKKISVKNLSLNSQILSDTIPASMEPGKSYPVSITVKNTGSHPWTEADKYRLGLDYANDIYQLFGVDGRAYIDNSSTANPGETATFKMMLTAPEKTGKYTLDFKMLKEGHSWFGPILTKTITVERNALSSLIVSHTIPETMVPGKNYNVSITLKNIGYETWSAANKHRLGLDYVSDSYTSFGLEGRAYLTNTSSISSGQSATFNLSLKAPSTEGRYTLNFKMLKEGVAWFGDQLNTSIEVRR